MKNYNKEEALKVIINVAIKYEERLRDNHFLIIYSQNNKINTVQVGFRDSNYLHMTGVKSRLSASVFYDSCINRKLSERDFEIDKKGSAQQKLIVLPYLPDLLYNNCMIGDFINSGICIRADYFVGNTKAVLSVGFRAGKSVDFPVTLYNEDIRKLTQPTCKVLAIFRKEYDEKYYTKCTYLSKGQDTNKLLLFGEIPLLDEIRAIEDGRRDRAENGIIPHEAINCDRKLLEQWREANKNSVAGLLLTNISN